MSVYMYMYVHCMLTYSCVHISPSMYVCMCNDRLTSVEFGYTGQSSPLLHPLDGEDSTHVYAAARCSWAHMHNTNSTDTWPSQLTVVSRDRVA